MTDNLFRFLLSSLALPCLAFFSFTIECISGCALPFLSSIDDDDDDDDDDTRSIVLGRDSAQGEAIIICVSPSLVFPLDHKMRDES